MRLLRLSLTLLLALLTLLLFPVLAFAQENRDQRVVTLPSNEVVNGDYLNVGDRVTVSGTVNGDVYIAGGVVRVDGTVNGDVLVAGGQVTIAGRVTEDVRVVGGEVIIDGTVSGSVSVAGGNVTLTNSASVGGSVVAAAGSIQIDAPVARSVTLAAGDVTLASTVGDASRIAAGNLTFTSEARINGDLDYWSENEVTIPPEATVSGTITQHPVQWQTDDVQPENIARWWVGASLLLKVLSFLSYLLTGAIIVALFPVFARNVVETIRERPLLSLLAAVVTMILLPFVMIVLFTIVIGIPLALIVLTLFFISLYLSVIYVSLFIGMFAINAVSRSSKPNSLLALLVGLILYELVTLIPVVGWIVTLFVVLLGFGAIILSGTNYVSSIYRRR